MTNIVGYARESTLDQAHNGFNMKLKAGIADVRFEDLPYSEVRDFLNDYVEMLDFNVKTKQVTIRYMTAGSKNA